MPSFDIASEVDVQTLDNAINTVKKEISNRYDFKGSPVEITLDKKQYLVTVEVESDMKMKQVIDVIISRAMKQGIDAQAFDFSKDAHPSGKIIRKEIKVQWTKTGRRQKNSETHQRPGFQSSGCHHGRYRSRYRKENR